MGSVEAGNRYIKGYNRSICNVFAGAEMIGEKPYK